MRGQRLFVWFLATVGVSVFLGGAVASAADQNTAVPHRGMVFVTSEIDDPTSKAEILDFVDSCRIDFVVFDFAWITGVWSRTRMAALREVCEQLKQKGVRVAIMYRPRALSPNDAPIHFAQDKDGKVAENHNHLCFAHDDSQAWGAEWGTRILKEIPSVDTIIIYNLLSLCECPECRGGKGMALTTKFLERCRSEWKQVRPGVQIGHVGVGDEYVETVDFFCPFVDVNRDERDAMPPFPQLRFEQYLAAHAKKWMAPLLKICWVDATNNTTADIVQSLKDCETAKTGFLFWYYGWVFHSDDRPYNPKTIVDALGGDWGKLSKYYAKTIGSASSQPAAAPPARRRALKRSPRRLRSSGGAHGKKWGRSHRAGRGGDGRPRGDSEGHVAFFAAAIHGRHRARRHQVEEGGSSVARSVARPGHERAAMLGACAGDDRRPVGQAGHRETGQKRPVRPQRPEDGQDAVSGSRRREEGAADARDGHAQSGGCRRAEGAGDIPGRRLDAAAVQDRA